MDDQMKALLEGINTLKSSQEETKEKMENMQRSKMRLTSNGWNEEVKACQLAASLRVEAAEVLQTLPNTE
ncbi:hypothetical protein TNCV_474641 [Trichonephila clavipes]|nr:hypothetical protein TNCV_474641 [Trichonephila clavipes]